MSAQSSQTFSQDGLPALPYNLRHHKKKIAIIWGLIFLDSCIAPLILFYPIAYASTLGWQKLFAITTSAFGLVTFFEYVRRSWRLVRKDDFSRPLGGKRKWLDCFHLTFTIGSLIVIIEMIVGTAPEGQLVRLLSMPNPSVMFLVGYLILQADILYLLGYNTLIRISSTPKGAPHKPGLFPIIEDVVANDGGGGKLYREALIARYEASPLFRQMLVRLGFFWSIPSILVAAACTAVVFSTSYPVAYAVGWGVPGIWGIIWAFTTIKLVQAGLRKEKEAWSKERAGAA
ncbi:MAG: hypothetical protein M1812_000449 [Candelaria pacifica]|nr:MAG: hypothetical protein M1812_000449 [Candelaria pacifica]